MRRANRNRPPDPEELRRVRDEIFADPALTQAGRILTGRPVAAPAPVPVRLTSPYYWHPWSLFSGLAVAALPVVTLPCWKILTTVAMSQLNAGLPSQNASLPVAISMADFSTATGMARMTVARGIREAIASGWLTQQKRRTPHGGNAVALYGIDWRKAESAERRRRTQA